MLHRRRRNPNPVAYYAICGALTRRHESRCPTMALVSISNGNLAMNHDEKITLGKMRASHRELVQHRRHAQFVPSRC